MKYNSVTNNGYAREQGHFQVVPLKATGEALFQRGNHTLANYMREKRGRYSPDRDRHDNNHSYRDK
jgi:hypothetical protein